MIIQIGTEVDESRILWKRKESDEWERADIDDLIEAYENRQKEPKPGDSISRQAAIEEIKNATTITGWNKYASQEEIVDDVERQLRRLFVGAIQSLPPVEPKRPKGEWIDEGTNYLCSECHRGCWVNSDYCPWCGADMRGDK